MNEFMKCAIDEALIGISNNEGGPFGAVVVKDGKIVGKGHNQVVKNNDPTCHGEMQAIRDACKNIGTFDLSECDLYTTGECCDMCLCASMWANIKHIYYGCTLKDNELIGFRDSIFDELIKNDDYRAKYTSQIDHEECMNLFNKYLELKADNKTTSY